MMSELALRHAESDIVEYYFESSSVPSVHSTWFLRFFERRAFVALVWEPGVSEAERRPGAYQRVGPRTVCTFDGLMACR